jgi:DUF2075 family protein
LIKRFFYSASIADFIANSEEYILGHLSGNNYFDLVQTQKQAWLSQIALLKAHLNSFNGSIVFEFAIPRMGRRIDVVLLIEGVIFILEFKVGEAQFPMHAIDQVWDYALDLKNFHETSFSRLLVPILISTAADERDANLKLEISNDKVAAPLMTNGQDLSRVLREILEKTGTKEDFGDNWLTGRYSPTPTIIEAAMALYNDHSVADVSRRDASDTHFQHTTESIGGIIKDAKETGRKAICFVTGVPGAGKTLVGLDIATKQLDRSTRSTGVFLSGNGPLVSVLREALTRDRVKRELLKGTLVKKGQVMSEVKVFIQNVHHFRDEGLADFHRPPNDHVAVFDEAQRAWNHLQTASFMFQKKQIPEFEFSEPEFLISCMDRHTDWAVIVCLIGGGQEINKGEGGIMEWIESVNRKFKHWDIHISSRLQDSEYLTQETVNDLKSWSNVRINDGLHLAVSMRSFRQENVSLLIKKILDLDLTAAKALYKMVQETYPIMLTRDLGEAKKWIRAKARGSERYGIVVSSQAQRLKPHAIDVKSPVDPVHWFLDDKSDVRSSYFMEDVATEFYVQGLELDWTCVVWDADFRYNELDWKTFKFVGDSWQNIIKAERKKYLKNAYRVLLTRARQGMVIVVPKGDPNDVTRAPDYYDCTYNYLKEVGLNSAF